MKNYKKIITFTLAAFLLISNIQLPFTYAHDEKVITENSTPQVKSSIDITPPAIDMNSLKINRRTFKHGETVNIRFKATDDMSGVKSVYASYQCPAYHPINNEKTKAFFLKYDEACDMYYGSLTIEDDMEDGIWLLSYITLKDMAGNEITMYSGNYDFYPLRFNVDDSNANDAVYPYIYADNLKIDKTNVTYGDSINISVKAIDASRIKNICISYYVNDNNDYDYLNSKDIFLTYNSETDRYEGTLYIYDNMQTGLWHLKSLSLFTDPGHSYDLFSDSYDFSKHDFTLSKNPDMIPIANTTVTTENDVVWSNRTINGDLYIAPNTMLNINTKITVTGNIYVLGVLSSYGGLTCNGTIYGTNIITGNNFNLSNGTIIMKGSNSINSTKISAYPVTDIPLRIDNEPIIKNNSRINLKGATLNIADMYIEDTKVDIKAKGTFDIKDFKVGNKNSITIKYITIFGNTITKTLTLTDAEEDINHDDSTNITDLSIIADNYNKTTKSNGWNSKLDLNKDGIIDIYDIVRVSNKMDN